MSLFDYKSILYAGGNIVVNCDVFSVVELKDLAFTAKVHGAHLTILKASLLNVFDCKSIAFSGGAGNVTFDFTK